MGVYYEIVCHKCKVYHKPRLLKMREIQMNDSVAAEIGRFFLEHRHPEERGLVEMVADEYSPSWDDYEDYQEQKELDDGRK